MVICLRMGKTYMAKTPPGDFKVTTLENPLLSKQVVISNLIPTYNWTFTPIPNWTCSIVTISHFQCTALSTWLTNCADPSTRLDHRLEKDVGYKVLLFITRWRSWSYLVTKSYGVQNIATSWRTRANYFFSHTLFHSCEICSCATYVTFYGP